MGAGVERSPGFTSLLLRAELAAERSRALIDQNAHLRDLAAAQLKVMVEIGQAFKLHRHIAYPGDALPPSLDGDSEAASLASR